MGYKFAQLSDLNKTELKRLESRYSAIMGRPMLLVAYEKIDVGVEEEQNPIIPEGHIMGIKKTKG